MNRATSPSIRLRRSARFVVLWAFGFATTLLLIGAWGRAVSTDEATIADSASAAIGSEEVGDRVTGWIAGGLAEVSEIPDADLRMAIEHVVTDPRTQTVVDQLVHDAVAALLAEPGSVLEIDVATAVEPLAPLVVGELATRGVAVEAEQVVSGLAALPPVTLDTASAASVVATAARVEGFLTVVVALAGAALVSLGALAVVLAEERVEMVRDLAARVALSAISFAILFRIGGWVIDPSGGRSPVAAGGSVLVQSNGHVFVIVGVGAAVIAAAVTGISWRRRGTSDQSAVDDDTRELIAV